ncbi:DUF427 domain-containing protein [Mycolicibacterium rhodesiae]|uniref:DUF427 domain-containing protein n=1 Tax=Mycolicibacterium rhodesiae TaxID=36814 RepID=A0A1X0J1V2_MYCRH|nr:DUF427 domain-containing protein [Mycolicibacterium rhodesiae]MCV7344652.1 DUF427 domain-containing protein [Mycolicibacterium rhodesiae]ORB55870.1 hypothetical protein BST42_05565 [Mycolicibacterium rhodesiae]
MTTREIKEPTADHPITITPTNGRVQVRVNGEVVADTRAALGLAESSYPVVQYIPLGDVNPAVLTCTTTRTYCPYKGEASYYSVTTGDATVEDAIWTYQEPYPAVAAIAGHVAFYPNKADISVVPD